MASFEPLDRREIAALAAVIVVLVAWMMMPVIVQPPAYHAFADRRTFLGIPNAADVLSNIAFVAVGLLGLWRLRLAQPLTPIQRVSLAVFFAGLTLTGFGSAYYHLQPTNATLVWDRLPLTIAFAGVYGAIFAERVSYRSGTAILGVVLAVGPASVIYWAATGDLSLYVVVQFGLVVGVLLALLFTSRGRYPLPWATLLLWYVIAKVAETADTLIWHATNEIVAGHVIKHLAAALGGLAIANALRPRRTTGVNTASR